MSKTERISAYAVKKLPNGHFRAVMATSTSSEGFWCAFIADFMQKPSVTDLGKLWKNGKPLSESEAEKVFAGSEGLWERLKDSLGEYYQEGVFQG